MKNLKGRALTTLLAARMRMDGLSVGSLANKLCISQSYLSQLLSGDKSIADASESILRKSAEYLRIPAVVCMLMAGKLMAEDFFETIEDFPQRVDAALKVVAGTACAREASVSLEQLLALPEKVKLLLVLQYEALTSVELIGGRVSKGIVETCGRQRVPFQVRLSQSD